MNYKKLILVFLVTLNTLNINKSQAQNNINTVLVQEKEEDNKIAQNYYDEAETHKKEANKLYKSGTIFFIVGISLFVISGYFRKKK